MHFRIQLLHFPRYLVQLFPLWEYGLRAPLSKNGNEESKILNPDDVANWPEDNLLYNARVCQWFRVGKVFGIH